MRTFETSYFIIFILLQYYTNGSWQRTRRTYLLRYSFLDYDNAQCESNNTASVHKICKRKQIFRFD